MDFRIFRMASRMLARSMHMQTSATQIPMRPSRHVQVTWAIALATLATCACQPTAPAPANAWAAERAQPLFELRSSFWVNLHQRLYAETSDPGARQHARPQQGADAFSPAERATWNAALAFYQRWIPSREFLTELSDLESVERHKLLVGH